MKKLFFTTLLLLGLSIISFNALVKNTYVCVISGWPGVPYQNDHASNVVKTVTDQGGGDFLYTVNCEWGTDVACPSCAVVVKGHNGATYPGDEIRDYVLNQIANGNNSGSENYKGDVDIALTWSVSSGEITYSYTGN